MSDRLPGSSPYNPIKYRNWEISLCSCGAADVFGSSHRFEYGHESYDGAPLESGGPPGDDRCGHAPTLDAAKVEIDEYEDEHGEKPVCSTYQSDGRGCCRHCGHFHGPDGAA